MATRINVYKLLDNGYGEHERVFDGWFDLSRAERWSDQDHNGNGSGGPGRGVAVYRTAQGRWVMEEWTNWQGEEDLCYFIEADKAREWLLANNFDEAVEEHFGEIEEERGPGRPAIGDQVQVRMSDDLKERLDEWAGERNISRAEAVRRILSEALGLDAVE